jgi:amino acid adenylation domain-containing protein
LTYRELDERANRLAHHLAAMGVGPEVLVGLCVGRSIDLVVGLLAILKSGGAYVPLDPLYPPERLYFMLEDSGAAFLLTESCWLDRFTRFPGAMICGDRDRDRIERESAANLAAGPAPSNLAYVIYTSGSTGRPKGVQVGHANLANLLQSMGSRTGIGPRDRLLAVTTISFDIAGLELLLPLISGAEVVLVDRDVAADGARLAEVLDDPSITFLQATPATWRLLLAAGWRPRSSLTMLCGGEALPRELADRLLDPEAVLWNLYGPTETTIWSAAGRVERGEAPITLGRPTARTQLYVLDQRMQPVPWGVGGELYIGGAGLARGYLHRPGLTADRFVPDPFGNEPGGRLYRTGDRVRWRADGGLEYLGRVDHQVKIRGYRVEPAEVEATLLRHPDITAAVVVPHPDASGETSLVGYVVASTPPPPDQAALRQFAASVLPAYMVPSVFVLLDELPLTLNGKVNRAALPAPGASRVPLNGHHVRPRNPAEETIAGIWEETLGVRDLGVHENFFDLGGHSLLATQVISRVRRAFGFEIPLRTLFEAPTIARMAEQVKALRHAGSRDGEDRIRRIDHSGPINLSLAQESLWFLDRLDPGQSTFNTYAAIRITGPLDLGALRRSLAAMVQRHESLRTTFDMQAGVPRQRIAERRETHIELVDLRHLPAEEREAGARGRAIDEVRRPFDLSAGPLERITLLQLDDEEHAVILVMHHIITDGWSFGVAAGELATLYTAFRQGRPPSLPELPVQYADFAAWQRARLASPSWAGKLEAMVERLRQVPPLELPTDHPRPPVRSSRGANHGLAILLALSEAVRELSRRESVTSYMTLLAALQVLLGRWSGQHAFAIGTPAANRTRHETAGLIGYFVNMLVLRADLSGDPTVRELLGRTRDAAIDAFENQEIPLELLIRTLQPDRDASRPPLFQVMFALQNNTLPEVGELEVTLSAIDVEGGTGRSKFDLSLALGDGPEGFQGSIEYSTELFDAGTIERLARGFARILEAMTAAPETRISALPILAEDERAEILGWSGRGREAPTDGLVHGLFEEQAARTPEETAIIAGDHRQSYAVLNARANRLAHGLIRRRVQPEALVGLMLAGPLDQMAAVLGTLKAGGAYVPLDPDWPPARLEAILAETPLSLLVVDRETRGRLPAASTRVLDIDELDSGPGDHDPGNPAVRLASENLAYAIFTSGSTGRPKGVMVTHGGLAAAAGAWRHHYSLDRPGLRHLQAASFAFDVFTGDWVRALCNGGTLVSCPRDVLADPARLARLIADRRIECMELVPLVAEGLASTLERQGGNLRGVRLLAVGSDTLSRKLSSRLARLVGPAGRVINSYGLTEATIDSTYHEEDNAEAGTDGNVPIGRPMAGSLAYVLDGAMDLVPPGVVGELHVGGAGVARGYLNDPRLTAERFRPDPHGPPGARVYGTGDLAHWLASGTLELVGRADHQVKVRGHRVELGEVEVALRSHPTVREAAVIARRIGEGGMRLGAFVAVEERGPSTEAEIRRHLRERLPRPMLPADLWLVDDLPVTSTGKIDRQRLAELHAGQSHAQEDVVAPRDELEARVLAIWEEILEIRPISVTADFFDLGGHSLLAVRLANRIEEEFGRSVPLSSLLLGSSIEGLAEQLRQTGSGARPTPLVHLGGAEAGRSVVLVHPIGGAVSCYRPLARCLEPACRVYGLQSPGLDGANPPPESLEGMASQYVRCLGPGLAGDLPVLAGWSLGGVIAFEMARQIAEARGECPLLFLIDSRAPEANPLHPPEDTRSLWESFLSDLARTAGGQTAAELVQALDLGPEALAEMRRDIGRVLEGLISSPAAQRLRQLFDVYRANFRALAGYRPGTYPGRVAIIRPELSTNCPPHDPFGGWGRLVTGGKSSWTMRGDHYSMMQPPAIQELAAILQSEIDRA